MAIDVGTKPAKWDAAPVGLWGDIYSAWVADGIFEGTDQRPDGTREAAILLQKLMAYGVAASVGPRVDSEMGGLSILFVDDEVVSGTGTSFNLAFRPFPSTSLQVWRNGIRETGWTLGGAQGRTLTLASPKTADDDLRVSYRRSTGPS